MRYIYHWTDGLKYNASMATCKVLAIVIFLMSPIAQGSSSCSDDIKVIANKPFTIACQPGVTHNASKFCLLKMLNGKWQIVKNGTLNHNRTHVSYDINGFPYGHKIYMCWAEKDYCQMSTKDKHCAMEFFALKTGNPASKPKLRLNKTAYYNYEELRLKWDLFPREKSRRNFGITRCYAFVHVRGKNSSYSCSTHCKKKSSANCTINLKEPPGTTVTVRIVSEKKDISANTTAEVSLNLDDYVVPGQVTAVTQDSIASHKAALSWTPPYSQAALNYTVKYSSKYDLNPKIVNISNEPRIILTNLCANTKYSFTITAHSANNASSRTVISNLTTPCSAPGRAQVKSNSYHINQEENSIVVYWKMFQCQYGCDDLLFYVNLYEVKSSSNREIIRTFNTTGDSRFMLIPKLKGSMMCHVTITATNRNGTGPESDSIIISPAKYVTNPPPNFTVIWYTHYVQLSWNPWAKAAMYTAYVCTATDRETSLNKPGESCSKVFWTEVGNTTHVKLQLCPENNTYSCEGGSEYCSREQDCISHYSQNKTKIGVAYHTEDFKENSPIIWANCMYDNTKSAEVPDFDVEPKPTSVVLLLAKGVSPCKEMGSYMHTYKARVISVNDTNDDMTVKEVTLNREDKVFVISSLQSKHHYNIELVGITDSREFKLATRHTSTTGTTDDEVNLTFLPFILVFITIITAAGLLTLWLQKRRRKTLKLVRRPHAAYGQDDAISYHNSEDEDDAGNMVHQSREAGDYDDITDRMIRPEMQLMQNDVITNELIPMIPMKNGGLKRKTEGDVQHDSALGTTLSQDGFKEDIDTPGSIYNDRASDPKVPFGYHDQPNTGTDDSFKTSQGMTPSADFTSKGTNESPRLTKHSTSESPNRVSSLSNDNNDFSCPCTSEKHLSLNNEVSDMDASIQSHSFSLSNHPGEISRELEDRGAMSTDSSANYD